MYNNRILRILCLQTTIIIGLLLCCSSSSFSNAAFFLVDDNNNAGSSSYPMVQTNRHALITVSIEVEDRSGDSLLESSSTLHNHDLSHQTAASFVVTVEEAADPTNTNQPQGSNNEPIHLSKPISLTWKPLFFESFINDDDVIHENGTTINDTANVKTIYYSGRGSCSFVIPLETFDIEHISPSSLIHMSTSARTFIVSLWMSHDDDQDDVTTTTTTTTKLPTTNDDDDDEQEDILLARRLATLPRMAHPKQTIDPVAKVFLKHTIMVPPPPSSFIYENNNNNKTANDSFTVAGDDDAAKHDTAGRNDFGTTRTGILFFLFVYELSNKDWSIILILPNLYFIPFGFWWIVICSLLIVSRPLLNSRSGILSNHWVMTQSNDTIDSTSSVRNVGVLIVDPNDEEESADKSGDESHNEHPNVSNNGEEEEEDRRRCR